jgi:predicted  nucleic acid-binding Zn-ribbon protein
MAIDSNHILERITAVEKRINDLQKIIENIPKLRQVGALKAVIEQEQKDLNSKVADLTARIERIEKTKDFK